MFNCKLVLIVIIILFGAFSTNSIHASGDTLELNQESRFIQKNNKIDDFKYTITRDKNSGILVHEKYYLDFFNSFAEDLLFLLPAELVRILAYDDDKYNSFVSSIKFYPKNNYWLIHNKFTNDELDKILWSYTEIIKSNNEHRIIESYANIIKKIFEYVSYSKNDILGDLITLRLSQLVQFNPKEHMIVYEGFDGSASVPELTEKLFKLSKFKYNNIDFYNQLLYLTADISSAIWFAAGNEIYSIPKQTFLVKNIDIDLKNTLDLSATIKDYSELSVVLNRNIIYPDEWRYNLIEKRKDDFAFERTRLERARAKGRLMNMDDLLVVFYDTRFKAIMYQQEFFIKH